MAAKYDELNTQITFVYHAMDDLMRVIDRLDIEQVSREEKREIKRAFSKAVDEWQEHIFDLDYILEKIERSETRALTNAANT